MKPDFYHDQIYAEPNGLRISVPVSGFDGKSLDILKQMIHSKETLIRKALSADSLEIIQTPTRILFPWFLSTPDSEDLSSILVFISALCARAKSGRPAPQLSDYESERYTFNRFLYALDLDAPEYQVHRKQLMKNLSGSVPFPDQKSEAAHRERSRQRRADTPSAPSPEKERF